MLPCDKCGYKRYIPGDAHVSCVFDWLKNRTSPDFENVPDHAVQWFHFPYNYDPVWGPDKCPGFSDRAVQHNIKEFTGIERMMTILK